MIIKTTWPQDLATVAKAWRWGRRRPVPTTAPPPADTPMRRRRHSHRPSPSLWAFRRGLIVDVQGMDAVVGVQTPVVVAANHQSVLDGAVLKAALPRAWRCSSSDPEAALAAGRSVVVFPEGEPSADGVLRPFSSSAAELAANHNVPIVPVAITGTFNLKSLLILRGLKERTRVQVRFSSPVAPRLRSIRGTTATLQKAVTELLAVEDLTWWDLQRREQLDAPETTQMAPWRRMWDQSSRRRRRRTKARRIWSVPETRGVTSGYLR